MAIPAVVQGTIETEDGKVFELDSPKGAAWVEAIGSFRFEPVGDSKPCTVRKEPSGYWYGCRKVAGKVRKKYIGKSSEINTAKLEGIAAALEVPPVQRVNKVAEVVQGVVEVAQVAEVTQDRLTALELEVASLRKALEALQEALPEKLESGDSAELPKVDNKVVEGLQNGLSNLDVEPEDVEFLKRLLAKKDPLISSDLWQEIERLKERNRQLRLKMRAERQESIEKISDLEDWNKGLTRRVQEKQARLDELEVTETELQNELSNLKTENENLRQALESLKQELAENTRYYTARLNEAGATIGTFKDKLEAAQAKNQRLQNDLGNSQAQVAELREQLAAERAEREENKKSAPVEKDLPEAADLLNKLKAKRKKSKTDLADLEAILELLQG
jgi:DNA repair exonuclease SbcCD ATPase subunit